MNLLVESVVSLFFICIIILALICVVKYRQIILDWIARPPKPRVDCDDLRDLAVLKRYGVQDAVQRVQTYQSVEKSELEALRPVKPNPPDKAETEGD